MKIAPKDLESFIAGDAALKYSLVLVYGPEEGKVHDYVKKLLAKFSVTNTKDFRLSFLDDEALARDKSCLHDAACSLSMFEKGPRVVHVRLHKAAGELVVKSFMDSPEMDTVHGETFIVVEAGDLSPRSVLRKAAQDSSKVASLGCYEDSPGMARQLIEKTLAKEGLRCDGEAMEMLLHKSASHRGVLYGELEKLILYAGGLGVTGEKAPTTITGSHVVESLGATQNTAIDSVVYAVGDGNIARLHQELSIMQNQGIALAVVFQAIARHFQLLHLVRGKVDSGQSPHEVLSALRPPLYFKTKQAVARQVQYWKEDGIAQALEQLYQAQLQLRRTSLPDFSLCSAVLVKIAARRTRSSPRAS